MAPLDLTELLRRLKSEAAGMLLGTVDDRRASPPVALSPTIRAHIPRCRTFVGDPPYPSR
jgi:hypothetical protein